MIAGVVAVLLCGAAGPPTPGPSPPSLTLPRREAAASAKPERKRSAKAELTGVLNVNRATEAELRLLPGIGKRRAQLIVERRDKRPFASVDEVGRLKGMRNLVRKLRAHLIVEGDTTLRPVRP